jgi:UDP-4-amino-4,6-dideoxy-N-acetyl-beta-L-altrosamine transaminase
MAGNKFSYIPYGQQNISDDDIQAVVSILNSDNITQGPTVPAFENGIKTYCGATHAVAVNSATSALHLACLALGVGPGDIVWTSPVTFVASANCALFCGATVDFVDIDNFTYNLCEKKLKEKLVIAEREGRLPKVVIPVHLAGQSCNMIEISKLAKHYGFKVIEDASHAIGTTYLDRKVGCCEFSDVTVFSFHPVKIITTAEGGVATTNSSRIANKLRLLRSHGITKEPEYMINASEGPWYYEQLDLGFNYRMTDIHAALGLSQLGRLDEFVNNRHQIVQRYNDKLANLPVRTPWQSPDSRSASHLYIIRLELENIKLSHREVFEFLRTNGIGVALHYMPVYRQPYFKNLGFCRDTCLEAEKYYAEAISLPIFPNLSQESQDRVLDVLELAVSCK